MGMAAKQAPVRLKWGGEQKKSRRKHVDTPGEHVELEGAFLTGGTLYFPLCV